MRLTSRAAIALACLGMGFQPLAAQQAPAPPPAPPREPVLILADTPLAARSLQLVRLLNGEMEPYEMFTDGFRAAIPDAQIKALSTNLTAQLGRALELSVLSPREGARAALEIRFERGVAKGGLAIDPEQAYLINELRFTAIEPLAVAGDTPAKAAADLAALPGAVGAWFAPLDGGAPLISLNPDTPLALGSAFKLYVLAALAEDVKAGRRKWSDVVPLSEKSLPSGQLQNWPRGAPVTLHSLASLMISLSDNTATDQLIRVLGRERILEAMKDSGHSHLAANAPFLSTRELFALKADPALTAAYRNGNAQARAALLEGIAGEVPTLEAVNAAFANGPKALDLEWFASPADIARLFAFMRRTADPQAFAILAINPQTTPAIEERWAYAGFKGGSEPGVINLTWLVTDKAGRDWVMTLGWNNPAAVVDDAKALALAQRILQLPR
ncbi:serine hydrolase [Erythrobacter sp. NE805]|uniref:serine hydrolase n=1 Tax=Erythrobacter sp. NE805 TaxID=3389875 RepID=UPI00396AFDC3